MSSKKQKVAEVGGATGGGKYALKKKLGSGAFGDVYLGEFVLANENTEEVAVKLEDQNTAHPQLMAEAKLLEDLKDGRGVAQVLFVGAEQGHNVMVMDLLGHTLEDYLGHCKGTFSLKTVLMIADQLLRRIEFVHAKGYLHRDIKPENFVLGRGKKKSTVYVIDFGLSRRYFSNSGGHIQYREKRNLTGTARYASINALGGLEQSRRDDLEAIGYMLMYFLRGKLPWQGLPGKTKEEKYQKIREKKAEVPLEELCNGHPKEFIEYLKYCRNLRFTERPDYRYLRKLFSQLYKRQGFARDWKFDWSRDQDVMVPDVDERSDDLPHQPDDAAEPSPAATNGAGSAATPGKPKTKGFCLCGRIKEVD